MVHICSDWLTENDLKNVPFGRMSGSRACAREPVNYELDDRKMKIEMPKQQRKIKPLQKRLLIEEAGGK